MTPPPTTATRMLTGDWKAPCRGPTRACERRGAGGPLSRGGTRVRPLVRGRRLHVPDLVLLHGLTDDRAVEVTPVGQRGQRADDDRLGVHVEVPAQRRTGVGEPEPVGAQ